MPYTLLKFLNKNNKITDLELIRLYQNTGKSIYLGELFTRYSFFSVAVCMKYLKDDEKSKDAVMDIFEKLAVGLKKQKIEFFKSWLYSVIRNHCLMILRSDKSKLKHLQNLQIEQENFMENNNVLHQNNTDVQLNKADLLQKALESLKEDQRNCIKMFYYEEKSYQEIVEITGLNLKKVKSNLQNAKRNLQIVIENKIQKLNNY